MQRITKLGIILLAIILGFSCSRQSKYSIAIENLPEGASSVRLFIYDSIYSACRELNNKHVNANTKQIILCGNVDKPELAYLALDNDSLKYYLVIDTVPSVLRMPISGNCMNIVSGSEENMTIEKAYRRIRALIFQHNSVFSEYGERKNDSTFTTNDEAKVEAELNSIDKELKQIIEETNSGLPNPYRHLNSLRYETIIDQLEE